MKRLVLASSFIVPCLLLLVTGGLYFLQEVLYRSRIQPTVNSFKEQQKRHLKSYLEDRDILSQYDLFVPSTQTKNAGTYLNPRLEWAFIDNGENSLKDWNKSGVKRISIPQEIIGSMEKWNTDWLSFSSQIDYQKIDFSWMKEIEQFDYWDLHKDSPIETLFQQEVKTGKIDPFSFAVSYPVPDGKTLLTSIKLRWMKAIHEGSFLEASRETRHLTRLLFTTESVWGNLVGLATIGMEILSYNYAKVHKLAIPAHWTPIPLEIKSRAARFAFGTAGYFSPLTEPDMLRKIFLDKPHTFALCASINEGLQNHSIARSIMSTDLPLERTLSDTYKLMYEIFEHHKKNCRFTYGDTVWNNPLATRFIHTLNRDPQWLKGNNTLASWFLYFPYTRTLIGNALTTLGTPTFLKRYEQPLETQLPTP